MSTHNIFFHGEIRKILSGYLRSGAMSVSATDKVLKMNHDFHLCFLFHHRCIMSLRTTLESSH